MAVGTGGAQVTTSYHYNELDQLDYDSAGKQYAYDRRGNLVQEKQGASTILRSYTWNGADRLIGLSIPGSSSTASFKYDFDGHRVQQVSTVGGTSTTTNYLWDTNSRYGDVLLEMDAANAVKTSYVLGMGELISQKRSSQTNPEYYLMDGQGSVRGLTNSSAGSVTESYSFDAFGSLKGGPAIPGSNYLYTGQQFDQLSGLYDLRARYYNPGNGRFLSRDSAEYFLTNPTELQRYGYTANNPLNMFDPSGFEYVEEGVLHFGSLTFKRGQLAAVSVLGVFTLSYFYGVILFITDIQIRSILSKAEKKECTAFEMGRPLCDYYLNHEGTKDIANLFDFWATALTLLGLALGIVGFILTLGSASVILPGIISLLAIAAGTPVNTGRLSSAAKAINDVANSNGNTGRIVIYQFSTIKINYGSW